MTHSYATDTISCNSPLVYGEVEPTRREQGLNILARELSRIGIEMVYVSQGDRKDITHMRLLEEGGASHFRSYVWSGPDTELVDNLHRLSCSTDLLVVDGIIGEKFPEAATLDTQRLFEKTVHEVEWVVRYLRKRFASRPLWAVILIGGKSSRMGQPKHLLKANDTMTWLEQKVSLVAPYVDGVVLSGKGDVPPGCKDLFRLTDLENVAGPLAGMSSAIHWRPDVSWIVMACDMPGVSQDSLQWLISKRDLEYWAVVPRLGDRGRGEPLFALYEPQCGQFFDQMIVDDEWRVRKIAEKPRVFRPNVPEHLRSDWINVNTPEELQRFGG